MKATLELEVEIERSGFVGQDFHVYIDHIEITSEATEQIGHHKLLAMLERHEQNHKKDPFEYSKERKEND